MKSNSNHKNNNLNDFLKRQAKPDDNNKATHTIIGDKSLKIFGGAYVIHKEGLKEFYDVYHKSVFIDKQNNYLTERQLDENSPILIDIDLRYDFNVIERIHTKEHIQDLIVLYLDELKSMLKFNRTTLFPIYIFEKPTVNRLEDKSLTKDGIHIIIGISLDRNAQSYLREKIIKNISEIWDIPKINTWESVFDEGITRGVSNWQLYGSRKPGNQAYELTQYFMNTFDEDDGEIMTEEKSINEIISPEKIRENLFKLSAQYDEHPKYDYTEQFIKILEDKKNKKVRVQNKSKFKLLKEEELGDLQLEDITTFEILQKLINKMLTDLTPQEYNVKEAHEYTQVLPERFYEPGSHVLNTQVALALKHTDDRLFLSWVMLRSKATDFDYSTIPDLYKRWNSYFREKENGVTIRSIIYWAKEYNKEGYERVRNETCEAYIDYTIYNPTDYDLAKILHYMFKDKYVCSDMRSKTWYIFKNHRWVFDRGQGLRLAISTDMYSIYDRKYNKLVEEAMNMDTTDSRQEPLQKKIKKINEVKTFSGSKGNFRKYISPKYKANRDYNNLPPLLNEMHQYVKEQYNSIYGYGCETDDVVAKYWFELSNTIGRDNVIIVSIDKDYKQFPCLMYNYHIKHKCIYDISEEEALYNFYEQMIVGDTADNVNYCKGYGKKYAEKYLAECKTKYEYTKKIYQLFKEIHKGKARQRYIECWNLLKLKTN
jgi:hypothetical protein